MFDARGFRSGDKGEIFLLFFSLLHRRGMTNNCWQMSIALCCQFLTTARQEIDDGINLKYSSRHLKMFDAVILTLSETCSRIHIPELHFLC